MSWLVILPIAIPLATTALSVAVRGNARAQLKLGIGGGLILLLFSLALLAAVAEQNILVTQVGGWPAPFGITLVADRFSAIMVGVAAFLGLGALVYSVAERNDERAKGGHFAVTHALLAGANGAFLTGDLFNLYVWFEVLIMSSFVLLTLGKGKIQIAGAVPYVAMNLVSSALFLSAVGLLYGITGALNLAELSQRVTQSGEPVALYGAAALLFVAFGLKSAIFPLFFWLPASYHTPPVAVSALFSGLMTKVGVYATIRVFSLVFASRMSEPAQPYLLIIAGATMLTGVLGAVSQFEVRKLLSFHIISQIGYMIMGLALFTKMALGGAIFFILHNIVVKSTLFFVAGTMKMAGGSFDLKKLGGLYHRSPLLSMLFLVPALSLAGFPPLTGFWGKLALIKAGLDLESYAIVLVSIVTSVLTTFSMLKIWNEGFWKESASEVRPKRVPTAALLPICALVALMLIISFVPGAFMNFSFMAAEELINRNAYLAAVLEKLE